MAIPLKCARCKKRPREHPQMGCLCTPCEAAIAGMTQQELDEDYRAHTVAAQPERST